MSGAVCWWTGPPVLRVSVTVSRPNEYTSWRPRRDVGIDWTEYRFGCLRLVVER